VTHDVHEKDLSVSILRFSSLAESEREGRPFWIATVIAVEGSTPVETGMKMAVWQDGRIEGTVGGGEIEKRVIERILGERPSGLQRWRYDLGATEVSGERTGMICGGMQEILVESFGNGTPLTILGGGHCGIALSALAGQCGFAVTVIDDRGEWASPSRHPAAAKVITAPFQQAGDYIAFGSDACIVIMTHGHRFDEMALRQCLGRPFRFLGLLGSTKKVSDLFRRLREDGVDESALNRIHAPVGLDIGSHTPQEIAVSIMAELIALRYGKDPGHRRTPAE
jgi:xanthine dehydrogenase accessory factor